MGVPFSEHLVLKYVLQNLTSASIYSRLRTLVDDIARVDVMEVSVCVPVMYRPCYLPRGCALCHTPYITHTTAHSYSFTTTKKRHACKEVLKPKPNNNCAKGLIALQLHTQINGEFVIRATQARSLFLGLPTHTSVGRHYYNLMRQQLLGFPSMAIL